MKKEQVTDDMIEEFRKKANRPNAIDHDVRRLIASAGSVDLAAKLITSADEKKKGGK